MESKGLKVIHALPGRVRLKVPRVKGNQTRDAVTDVLKTTGSVANETINDFLRFWAISAAAIFPG